MLDKVRKIRHFYDFISRAFPSVGQDMGLHCQWRHKSNRDVPFMICFPRAPYLWQ